MAMLKLDEAAIFNGARRIEEPKARHLYIQQECGGEQDIQARIEALLRVYDEEHSFLEIPASALLANVDFPITEGPGTVIGPYKLLEQIGEGGFGVVFMAEQQHPVRRMVALKVVKPGMDTRQVVARFEAERQALALMDHPNIAKVLDAGSTGIGNQESVIREEQRGTPGLISDHCSLIPAEGRPYFVMELVRGVAVTDFCDQNHLPVRQRLELFVTICQAVQHAHQKGIIHRDMKPSNVLVTLHDGTPVAKVIDFGIAKALGQKLTEKTLFTNFAQLVGTPLYMSPEQAEMSGLDVDTRSDIYSLGVLLYELLTGTTPFDRERLRTVGFDELRRIILEEEPAKPSARISTLGAAAATVSDNRKSDPKRLSQLFRGELDWIVMKCLEKDRTRRYDTAIGLARDIQRYLNDEPVEACPPSASYKLRKFLVRNKGPVVAAALVLLALLGGMVGTTWGLLRAESAQLAEHERAEGERLAKDTAEKRLAQIEKGNEILGSIFTDVNPRYEQREGKSLRELLGERLQEAANQLDEEAVGDPTAVARLQHLLGKALRDLGYPAKAIPLFNKARATLTAHLGPDHTDTLLTMNHLALAYTAAGQNDLALPLHQEAVRLAKARYGADCHATANAMQGLASSYWTARKLNLAIPLLQETLKFRKATLGLKDPHTLETMNGLGLVYAEARKLDLAIPMLEETVELRREVLGPKHTDFLASLNNLAIAYQADSKLELALPRFEEVLKLIEAKVGPNHPNTLSTKNNLAFAYRTAGKLDLALPLAQQAVRGAEKDKFQHEKSWMFIATLVDIHEQLKQFDQAQDWRRKWAAAVKEKEGKESVAYAEALANLATAYWKAKQLDKSIPLFEELLPLHRKILGEMDPKTLTAMTNLGVNYRDAGRLEEAIALLEQAHGNGRKHESLRWVGGELLLAYVRAGKSAAASALAQDNVAAARKALPPDSPQLGDALAQNGLALVEIKAWAEAEPILRDCIAIREKKAPDDWRTSNAKSMLGQALLGQKKYADAEPLLVQGYTGMKQRQAKIPPQGKVRLTEALERLVQLYDAWGKPDKAAEWRKRLETIKLQKR